MKFHATVVHLCHQVRVGALVAVLSTLLMLTLGSLWLSSAVQSAPVSPTAPGSIAGMVTNQAGVGLAGIDVHLLRDGESDPTRSTTTDSNGNYRFAVLGPGVYRVEFVDPAEIYAFQFYPAATTLAEATLLFIAGDNRTGIDTQLPVGGVITGIVTGTDGIILDQSLSVLYRMVTPGEWQQWSTVEFTSTVVFRYSGLATGNYRLCAGSNAWGVGSFFECYDDGDEDTATPIAATAGMTTSNINILLGNHILDIQVKGRVTDEAGQPLAQVEIQSYDAEFPSDIRSSTRSNAQGDYRLNFMHLGLYILRIVDPAGIYAPEYYNDVQHRATATIFRLRNDSFVDGINISLTLAAHITGTVLLNNQIPPAWGSVTAFQEIDGAWQKVAESYLDPATGHYHITGLVAGTYSLIASGYLGGNFFKSAVAPEQGRLVTVASGEAQQQIDFSLGEGAYEGTIQGMVSASTLPVAGIRVDLYHASYPYSLKPPVYYLYTDSDGGYRFINLLNGTYLLRFSDPTGRYAATYYPDQPNLGGATPLTIQGEITLTNAAVPLTPAGSITGRVTRYDGTPIAGAVVMPFWDRRTEFFEANLQRTTSDAQGNYRLAGLAAGNYCVYFSAGGSYFGPHDSIFALDMFYGDAYNLDGAVAVPVQASQTTPDINVILGPKAVVKLPVIQR